MLKKIVTILISALAIYSIYTTTKLKRTLKKLDRTENNLEFYRTLTSTSLLENNVLQLTVEELLKSNDSILTKLEDTRKQLDIKAKTLSSEAYVKTEVKDTVLTVIEKDTDFTSLLVLNGLTNITVSRKDTILDVILDVSNEQYVYVTKKKVYRNTYKNGWLRFWHFDWKKVERRQYQIYNTNPLILVKETRVIEF